MNFYEKMKNYAQYIDAGMKTLNECARTSNFQLLSSNEDEKLMSDINGSINSMKEEIDNIFSQASRLNGLNDFISRTVYSIQEIKRVGNSLGLQFQYTNQNEYPPQNNLDYNVSTNLQTQPQQPNDFRKDPINNIPNASNPNIQPRYYEYGSKPIFREITDEEYKKLPAIVPLLVKLDDMNKHYQNLINNMNNDTFIISSDDFSEIIQLSSSRMNAFIRALISLKRMTTIEDVDDTKYKML